MKNMKRVAALVMAVLFMGVGVLSNVGTISQVEAAPKISVKKKTLNQGSKLTLKVTGGKGTIKWSVNNSNVKISKKTGKSTKVTAVKAGTSKVTAKVGSKKLVSTIKVNGLNIVKKDLNEGASFTVKAVGLGKKIKWSVNKSYVKISKKSGTSTKVTAVKKGTAVVTAKVGKKSYKCTVTVKHVHKPVALAGKAATCTTAGLTAGTKCSACGQIITAQKTIPALGHKEVKIDGKAATCYEAGLTEGTSCSVCKVVIKAQTEIPALAHSNKVHQEAVAAGCHSLGHVEYWFCPDCEGFWTDEACTRVTNSKSIILPATGSENMVHQEAVAAGCHSLGHVEHWYCPDCEGFWLDKDCTQLTNSKSVIIPASGSDNLTHVPAVAPTATENGNVEYWYCPDCEGFWLDEACTRLTNSKSVILPATGEPETPVEGSEFNPIFLPLQGSETGAEATITVPAGATVWYQGRVAGMNLLAYSAGNEMYSIIYNGETFESYTDFVEGQNLEIPSLMGRPMVSFAIVNASDVEKTFSLSFAYPLGTEMNPDTAVDLSSLWVTLAADSQGYYYKYTPEVDETVQLVIQNIYCDVADAQADFNVTVTDPDTLVPVMKNYLSDAVDGVLTVDLKAGMDVIIQVVMVPGADWTIPAAEVVIGLPKGTPTNPEIVYGDSTDVSVDAGAEYYLEVYAAGNTLVVSGGDAIVTIDGEEYTAVDGVVSVDIPTDPMAMGRQAPVSVVIKNTTGATVTYTVSVVAPEGTIDNPEVVVAGTPDSVEMAEGSTPHFYTFIAEQDGVLEITIDSTTGWTYTVNNLTTYIYGEEQWCGDTESSNVYKIEVSAGDEIQIIVNTSDASDKWAPAPAGTITLDVDYASDTNMDVEEDEDTSYGDIF